MLHVPRPPVQVAFLQGAIPLQAGACFDKLIDLLQGPTGGGDGGGLAIATTCQGRGCAKKKEAAAWRTTGSSWLGRRIILEPACIGAKFLHPCGAFSKCNPSRLCFGGPVDHLAPTHTGHPAGAGRVQTPQGSHPAEGRPVPAVETNGIKNISAPKKALVAPAMTAIRSPAGQACWRTSCGSFEASES